LTWQRRHPGESIRIQGKNIRQPALNNQPCGAREIEIIAIKTHRAPRLADETLSLQGHRQSGKRWLFTWHTEISGRKSGFASMCLAVGATITGGIGMADFN
jgi:hypothetical protein